MTPLEQLWMWEKHIRNKSRRNVFGDWYWYREYRDLENPRRGNRGNMEEGTNIKMDEWNNTVYD